MKSILPLLTIAIIFSSCTAAYKSGQTPDDVYFSPARPQAEYVSKEDNNDQYNSDDEYRDDRYLRMMVHDRRWSTLDDGWYSYNPNYYTYYNYNKLYFYNSPWDAYNYWNYYHNPYYTGIVVIKNPAMYSKPRTFNLDVYNPPANNNPKGIKVYTGTYNTGSNTNNNYHGSGTNAGNFLRNVFNNSGSSSNSSSSPSSSSRSSSSGGSSGSSGGGGGHASVRRF